jgi:hypothetical protein
MHHPPTDERTHGCRRTGKRRHRMDANALRHAKRQLAMWQGRVAKYGSNNWGQMIVDRWQRRVAEIEKAMGKTCRK